MRSVARPAAPGPSAGTRLFLTLLAYVLTLAAVTLAAFFAVIVLAGPHGGLLPRSAETPVLALAWLAVIVVPVLVARLAWRRAARPATGKRKEGSSL